MEDVAAIVLPKQLGFRSGTGGSCNFLLRVVVGDNHHHTHHEEFSFSIH